MGAEDIAENTVIIVEVDGQQLSLRNGKQNNKNISFITGKVKDFHFTKTLHGVPSDESQSLSGPTKTLLSLSPAQRSSYCKEGFKQHCSEHDALASICRQITPSTHRGQTKSQANTQTKSNQHEVNKTFFKGAGDKTKSEQITLFVLHQMPLPFLCGAG